MTEYLCATCGRPDGRHAGYCPYRLREPNRLEFLEHEGFEEIKRMEYLMSKAPCIARLNELAAYAAKDEEQDEFRAKGGYYSGYQDD